MNIAVEELENVTVIRLADRFDAYTAPAVREKLLELQARGRVRIIVDLSAVDFVDSTGLVTLVAGLKHCRRAGGELVLIGLRSQVKVIFELTRLDHAFQIYQDEAAALSALGRTEDVA
ncbi:MAG: STAS domain-containing protein [Anaerolineae bacterium]|jgi:anti-anti-sigma factor|nr:STAS domain-containing protein [Anaerolineae bacterium]